MGARHRHILVVRAVDGWLEGNAIATSRKGVFGKARTPDRGGKTHDPRSRSIRLVRVGPRLMRGGYSELLRYNSRDKHTNPER
nr:DUF2285 domain-containing protein [Bradyrhizobium sacchari]